MVAPVADPDDPEAPLIGVVQCLNKRSLDAPFSARDRLSITQLARQAATAIVNATRYDAEYRREVNVRRVLDLCETVPKERDLGELPRVLCARAKDLLAAHRARLLFWDEAAGALLPSMVRPATSCWPAAN